MLTSIAQIKAIISEQMAKRLTWERFVNWHDGVVKNIDKDTAQEICVDSSKDVVKGMGPKKTPKTGSKIATDWSLMQPKIECWQPQVQSWAMKLLSPQYF